MQYKFAVEHTDYSDLASGRVFHSLPGRPAFPVRLGSEIFQRCIAIRAAHGETAPCLLYDPCCGAAYQLSVLACLHREMIGAIIGSDIDEKAVAAAAQNLGLLNADGLEQRIRQIDGMLARYGKPSHQDALASAHRLRDGIATHPLKTGVFQASALDETALRKYFAGRAADIILTDVPYGQHSQWQDAGSNPIGAMLTALLGILSPAGLVAIASDKQQKVAHERYQRIDHFQVGKRRAVILRPKE